MVAEDRANVGITVLVLKTADQKTRLMRVQAPLGVLLPAGLGLKIDNVDVGRAVQLRQIRRPRARRVGQEQALARRARVGEVAPPGACAQGRIAPRRRFGRFARSHFRGSKFTSRGGSGPARW